jgi:hypothetical protein
MYRMSVDPPVVIPSGGRNSTCPHRTPLDKAYGSPCQPFPCENPAGSHPAGQVAINNASRRKL